MMLKDKSLRTICLATGNQGKISEFESLFVDLPVKMYLKPKGFEVEETGDTFAENARIKAISVARETGYWAIADDSGLCIKALNGAPGVFSSRYGKSDLERIQRVLGELEGCDVRNAYFSAAICVASEDGSVLIEVAGLSKGLITFTPRGERGFGYDPIFEIESLGLTFAEMTKQKKAEFSHRGKAFKKLKPLLKKLFSDYPFP